MKTKNCTIWLAIDSNGCVITGSDRDSALSNYVRAYPAHRGELSTIKLVIKNVPLPSSREISGEFPAGKTAKAMELTIRDLDIENSNENRSR